MTVMRCEPGVVIFGVVIIFVGAAAGLGAMLRTLLLHVIQHAAYGYDLGAGASPESFLQGVTTASLSMITETGPPFARKRDP